MQMFQLEGHEIRLLGQLQRQQRNLQFCDTLLQTDGISVPTHSCVLAALSPYLSERLSATAPPPFGHKRHLKIQSITAGTLLKLVGLLYSGKMEVIGSAECDDVLAAARRFGITNLKEDHLNTRKENKHMDCKKYSVTTPAGSDWAGSWRKRDAQVQVGNACGHCGAYSSVKKQSFGTQTESADQDSPLTPRTLDPVLPPEQNLSITAQNKNKTHDLHLGKQPNNSDCTFTSEPLDLSLNPPGNSLSPHNAGIQEDAVEHAQGEEAQEQTACAKTTTYPLQATSEVKMGSSAVHVCPANKVARKNLTRMRQMEAERFSVKVKLRRKTSGGVWEVVGLQDLDEKLCSVADEAQESSDPGSRQLTDVCYSPSAAAEPQDCAVESEEQIEKLLEDIMMGLDILPDLESDHKKSGCHQQNQLDFSTSDSVGERGAEQTDPDPLTQSCAAEVGAQRQPIKPHDEAFQQENVSDGRCGSPSPDIAPQQGEALYTPGFQDILGCSQDGDFLSLLALPKMQHPCCLSPIDSPEADRPPQDPGQPRLQDQPTPNHNCIVGHSDVGSTRFSADQLELQVSLHNSDTRMSQSQTRAKATFRRMRRKRSASKEDRASKRRRILKHNTVSDDVGRRMDLSKGKTGEPNETAAIQEQDCRDMEADKSKARTGDPVMEDESVKRSTDSLHRGRRRTGKVRLKQRHLAAAASASAAVRIEEMSERRNKEVHGSRRVEIDDCNILTLGERNASEKIVTRREYQKFVNGSNTMNVKSVYLANIVSNESHKHGPEDEVGGVTADWKHVPQDENQNEILTDDVGPQRHDPKLSSPTACCLDSLLVNITEEAAGSPLQAQDVPSQTLHTPPKYGNPAIGGSSSYKGNKTLSDFEMKLPHSPAEGSTSSPDAHVLTLDPACSTNEEIVDCTSERTDLFPQTEEEESEVDVVLQSPGQEACGTACVGMLDISPTDEEEEVEVNVTEDDSQ